MDKEICEVCECEAPLACGRCLAVHYCSRDHQRQDYVQHKHYCKNYCVRSSDQHGQYMAATCNIVPGSLILKEQPILVAPMTNSDLVCLACHAAITEKDFYKCPDCGWPMCNAQCAYAESHLLECDVLAQDVSGIGIPKELGETPRYDLIMILRGLLLKNTNPTAWDELMSMESHADIRKEENDPYCKASVRYFLEVCKVDSNLDEVHHVRGAIVTNCLIFRNEFNVSLRGIYPKVRLFNHSCCPNITITTSPSGEIEARSAIDIAKNESLCICYTGTIEPLWKRQQYLTKVYKFCCKCPRCSDPTELGTYFSCPRCPDCRRSYMLPPGDGTVDVWKCRDCGLKYGYIDVMQEFSEWLHRIEASDFMQGEDLKKLYKQVYKLYDTFNDLNYIPHQFTVSLLLNLKDDSYICMKTRQEIWDNHLTLYNILEPGMTRRRGVTLYNLANATLAMIEAGIKEKEIWLPRVPELLQESLQQLREAQSILNLEPRESKERRWLNATREKMGEIQRFQLTFAAENIIQ